MALAGPVFGVAGAVVLLAAIGFSRFMASPTDELVATFALQLTLTAVACVLWLDPRQRSSAVLVGLAVVAISALVMNSEEAARRIGAYWPMVGWAAEWWAVVPLLVVLLRYPEARIRDRLSRAIVVAAIAVFVVWRLLYAWFWDPVFAIPGYQGPMRWLTLPGIHTRTWNDVAAHAETVASLALMALVVVVMVRRFRSASGLSAIRKPHSGLSPPRRPYEHATVEGSNRSTWGSPNGPAPSPPSESPATPTGSGETVPG
jgi:hypothetical protein